MANINSTQTEDVPGAAQPFVSPELMNQTVTMMASMATSFTLSNALQSVRHFDGRNIALKEFIQDVRNAARTVPQAQMESFLNAVMTKLRGPARDSLWGKAVNNVNDLVSHLKRRFAPGRNYSYYKGEINTLRMRQGEPVGEFYDRLNILVNGAKKALKEMIPRQDAEPAQLAEQEELLALPLQQLAIDTFLKGLPEAIAWAVDGKKVETLEQAYEEAI